MSFKLSLLEKKSLERVDTPDGRFYTLPSGKRVPSVTTFLRCNYINEHLEEWKKRVGPIKATEAAERGAKRGSKLHHICENYLLNNPYEKNKIEPLSWYSFIEMKRILDAHVEEIYGIEIPLYSEVLGLAGTADMVCKWNGELAIVDFKTSNWVKKENDILDYWYQTLIYSLMFQEMYGMIPKKLVIIMSFDLTKNVVAPLLWVNDRMKYLTGLKELINEAKNKGQFQIDQ